MNPYTQDSDGNGFAFGLLAGTVVGAGLALWMAPRLMRKGRRVRDDVADAVVRGAKEVERFATGTKSDGAQP